MLLGSQSLKITVVMIVQMCECTSCHRTAQLINPLTLWGADTRTLENPDINSDSLETSVVPRYPWGIGPRTPPDREWFPQLLTLSLLASQGLLCLGLCQKGPCGVSSSLLPRAPSGWPRGPAPRQRDGSSHGLPSGLLSPSGAGSGSPS